MGESINSEVKLQNPYHKLEEKDVYIHFSLNTVDDDIAKIFGDVKFVFVGGSPSRMLKLIEYFKNDLDFDHSPEIENIAPKSNRYVMYKLGPILCVNHGMGIGSISIMMHEVIKMLYHAKCKNVSFIRVGTCGGLGLEPGSVIVSKEAVNSLGKHEYNIDILGKTVCRPASLSTELHDELMQLKEENDEFDIISGKTMCTNDFYEGQGRMDGSSCSYTVEERDLYLKKIFENGVTNIEMESVCFASMCQQANIKAGIVCVSLIDRLKGDTNLSPKELLEIWEKRPFILVSRFLKKKLNL